MPRGAGRTSNCSMGLPVDLFWYGCLEECEQTRHIDAIVDALMDVVAQAPGRRWNPYTETYARSEFRRRLVAASQGELEPMSHVKHIDTPLAADMFEIRWQDVRVGEVDSAGRERGRGVHVRLLHAEPGALGLVAVGLHVHEKVVVPRDARATRSAQDTEIAVAIHVYSEAVPALLLKSPAGGLRRDGEGI